MMEGVFVFSFFLIWFCNIFNIAKQKTQHSHIHLYISLVEIGPVVLEKKILKSCQFIFIISQLSPPSKGVGLHLYKLESPSPRDTLYQDWLKLAQYFLEKKMKMWKVYRRTDRRTNDGRQVIRKAHELKNFTSCDIWWYFCLFYKYKYIIHFKINLDWYITHTIFYEFILFISGSEVLRLSRVRTHTPNRTPSSKLYSYSRSRGYKTFPYSYSYSSGVQIGYFWPQGYKTLSSTNSYSKSYSVLQIVLVLKK